MPRLRPNPLLHLGGLSALDADEPGRVGDCREHLLKGLSVGLLVEVWPGAIVEKHNVLGLLRSRGWQAPPLGQRREYWMGIERVDVVQ